MVSVSFILSFYVGIGFFIISFLHSLHVKYTPMSISKRFGVLFLEEVNWLEADMNTESFFAYGLAVLNAVLIGAILFLLLRWDVTQLQSLELIPANLPLVLLWIVVVLILLLVISPALGGPGAAKLFLETWVMMTASFVLLASIGLPTSPSILLAFYTFVVGTGATACWEWITEYIIPELERIDQRDNKRGRWQLVVPLFYFIGSVSYSSIGSFVLLILLELI